LVGGTGVAVGGGGAQEATTAPAAATADNRKNSRRVTLRFIFLSSFGILGDFQLTQFSSLAICTSLHMIVAKNLL
jgi:hypothetical protein